MQEKKLTEDLVRLKFMSAYMDNFYARAREGDVDVAGAFDTSLPLTSTTR